jgi:Tfp pilus assembly protein PilF
LHLLTAGGWYLLVRRLAGPTVGLVATTLFVVAPVNVESVAYVTGRNNIQVACLLIYALLAYLRGQDRGGGFRTCWPWLSLLLYAAALLTKEFAVFFPLVLLACRTLPNDSEDRGWLGHSRTLIPYLFAAACYMVLRSAVIGRGAFPLAISAGSLADSVRSIVAYLRLLLFPLDLAVTHTIATGDSLSGARDWLSLLVVLLLIGALIFTWSRDRRLAFFLCWFLVFLLPVCGIIAFNPVPVAERYLYVGSLGAYTVLALLGMRCAAHWRRTALLVCCVVVVMYSWRTVKRVADWKDDLTLAQSTVKSRPDSPVSYYLLGNAYFNRERIGEALVAFRRSVELNPSFPHARMNLARSYHLLGQLDDAIREYRLSLEAMPDSAQLHGALADAYYQKGLLAEAAAQLRQKIAITPDDAATRNNLTLVEQELAGKGGRR